MKLIQRYWQEPNFQMLMFFLLFGGPFWDLLAVVTGNEPELVATYLTYGIATAVHIGLIIGSTSKRIRRNHGI